MKRPQKISVFILASQSCLYNKIDFFFKFFYELWCKIIKYTIISNKISLTKKSIEKTPGRVLKIKKSDQAPPRVLSPCPSNKTDH